MALFDNLKKKLFQVDDSDINKQLTSIDPQLKKNLQKIGAVDPQGKPIVGNVPLTQKLSQQYQQKSVIKPGPTYQALEMSKAGLPYTTSPDVKKQVLSPVAATKLQQSETSKQYLAKKQEEDTQPKTLYQKLLVNTDKRMQDTKRKEDVAFNKALANTMQFQVKQGKLKQEELEDLSWGKKLAREMTPEEELYRQAAEKSQEKILSGVMGSIGGAEDLGAKVIRKIEQRLLRKMTQLEKDVLKNNLTKMSQGGVKLVDITPEDRVVFEIKDAIGSKRLSTKDIADDIRSAVVAQKRVQTPSTKTTQPLFEKAKKYKSAKEVIEDINIRKKSIPPAIKKDMAGQEFSLEKVNIDTVIKNDPDLADFIKNYELKSGKSSNVPVIIGEWQGNKKAVMDGWHRIAAAKKAGLDEVEAYVSKTAQETSVAVNKKLEPSKAAQLEYRRFEEYQARQQADLAKEEQIIQARDLSSFEYLDSELEYGYQNFKKYAGSGRRWMLDTATDDATLKRVLKDKNVDDLFFSGASDKTNDEVLEMFKQRYEAEREMKQIGRKKTPSELALKGKQQAERVVRKEAVGRNVPVKQVIQQKPQESKMVRTERQLLKMKLREQNRGGLESKKVEQITTKRQVASERRQGKRVLRRELTEAKKTDQKAMQRLSSSYKRIIADRTKALDKLKDKTAKKEAIQQAIYQYAKDKLPLERRGVFLTAVTKADTRGDLIRAFRQLDSEIAKIQKKEVIKNIRKIIENIDQIPVNVQKIIRSFTDKIEWKGHLQGTLDRLKATKAFLEQNQDSRFPSYLLDELKILDRKPLKDLSTLELTKINEAIEAFFEEGKVKMRVIQETKQLKRELALRDIAKGSVNLDRLQPEVFKNNPRLSEKMKNAYRKMADLVQSGDWQFTFMDRFFDMLDGAKGYKGANYNFFKKPVDEAFSNYLKMRTSIFERLDAVQRKLDLKEQDYLDIGVYAIREQEGGVEKLLATGLTEKQIRAVSLNEKQTEMYTFMRMVLDELWPYINDVRVRTENKELGWVNNYFPFQLDYSNPAEIGEQIESAYRKTSTSKGFTQERVGGKRAIKLNALELFTRHVEKSTYYINMDETVKQLGGLANSPQYRQAVGNKATKYVLDWIDSLSRQGSFAGERPNKFLDTMRRNMGVGVLGFKLSSMLKQPLALYNGAAELGPGVFREVDDILFKKDVRSFILNASEELKSRKGGDFSFLELSSNQTIKKVQEMSLKPMQALDQLTAGTVWLAAYKRKLKELGKQFSLDTVEKEAKMYADRVVRLTQSSGQFKDLPLALIREHKQALKTIFTFQSFVLNQWNYIKYDFVKLGVSQDKTKAVWQIMFLVMAGITEYAISSGIADLFNPDAKDDDKQGLGKTIVEAGLNNIPLIGNLYYAMKYDSNPIPLLNTIEKALSGYKRLATGKEDATKQKGAIDLASSVGTLFGVPGSTQAGQVVKKFLGENRKKNKTEITNLPALPKLPRLPKLPQLPSLP